MNYEDYTKKMKELQYRILLFIDKEDNIEENYENVEYYIKDNNIKNNKYELKSLLYLISKISNNHYRSSTFFPKITKIIQNLKDSITRTLSHYELYEIFSQNKTLLLFFIEEKMIVIDKQIANQMMRTQLFKIKEFFKPELKPFLDSETDETELEENDDEKVDETFFKRRKNGNNHHYISEIIRKDLIEDFIIYVNKNDYPLNSKIAPSIFETNLFLHYNTVSLIEYASFFGSIQIFRYLYKNQTSLTPSIWLYGIHSDNPEILNILEEENVKPIDKSYEECLKEAVKCHHNDIANYIINNLLNELVEKSNLYFNINDNLLSYCFHFYNFAYFPDVLNNNFIFTYACKYDYFQIVQDYLISKKIDLSANDILTFFFF